MRVYRRENGVTVVESAPFTPFLLAADERLLRESGGGEVGALEGTGDFRWIARFGSWAEALAARDRCRETSGTQPRPYPKEVGRILTILRRIRGIVSNVVLEG